jgi:putative flippase GtrA
LGRTLKHYQDHLSVYFHRYAISISIGTLNNFILNTFFNFKLKDRLPVRFLKFYCIGLGAPGVSSLLLYVFIDHLNINVALAKIATITIVVLLQYNLNKTFSFKDSDDDLPVT